jgi:hypothetical protein
MRFGKWILIVLAVTGVVAALSACTLRMGVEPWERDLLAQPTMRMDGMLDDDIDDHIYFSKEASSGGRGFGGGGCGCN